MNLLYSNFAYLCFWAIVYCKKTLSVVTFVFCNFVCEYLCCCLIVQIVVWSSTSSNVIQQIKIGLFVLLFCCIWLMAACVLYITYLFLLLCLEMLSCICNYSDMTLCFDRRCKSGVGWGLWNIYVTLLLALVDCLSFLYLESSMKAAHL